MIRSLTALLLCSSVLAAEPPVVSEHANFSIETVVEGLEVPWGMAFLPGGDALIVERDPGRLHRLAMESGKREQVEGLPPMLRSGKISCGLFDVRPHPEFGSNGLVYLAYCEGSEESAGLVVDQAELRGTQLVNPRRLFSATPRLAAKWHFGGRLVLQGDYLYVTTGDGYEFSAMAQRLDNHLGKIIRLRLDGSLPEDNPYRSLPGALPELYAIGVRNPQGMAIHPDTGELWINEHGPQGGDEINIVRAGTNYGWPVITYGEEYGGGPVGDGIQRRDGMAQPHYYWRPSIAPSGLAFYQGEGFPAWRGSAFSGALALKHINRLALDGERVMHEERLLEGRAWRVRFVETGPDGYLYFGTDDGAVRRLLPAP